MISSYVYILVFGSVASVLFFKCGTQILMDHRNVDPRPNCDDGYFAIVFVTMLANINLFDTLKKNIFHEYKNLI